MSSDPNDQLLPGCRVFPEDEHIEHKSLRDRHGLVRNVNGILKLINREDDDYRSRKPGIKKVINAMYNSTGGAIYLGIREIETNRTREVELGADIDDNGKVRIEKLVSQIFKDFYPSVTRYIGAYQIKFINVTKGKKRICIIVDHSKRHPGVVHFMSNRKSIAYRRIGTSCEPIPPNIICNTVRGPSTSDITRVIVTGTVAAGITAVPPLGQIFVGLSTGAALRKCYENKLLTYTPEERFREDYAVDLFRVGMAGTGILPVLDDIWHLFGVFGRLITPNVNTSFTI
jgi:hypothetical protein